jgi:hypothetical protein
MADQRQHDIVADLKEILEIGAGIFTQKGGIDYSFEVFEEEDGTKFIGITADGHKDDVDELSEWAITPERA